MESSGKIRVGFMVLALPALVLAYGACASGPQGGQQGGSEPITIQVDNMSSRVVTVERVVATGAGRPVTVRVGLVRGETQQTFSIPWNPSRLAHQILWLDGLNSSSYRVETCQSEEGGTCSETTALHLPPGAEVQLVIDRRLEATMYYRVSSEGG